MTIATPVLLSVAVILTLALVLVFVVLRYLTLKSRYDHQVGAYIQLQSELNSHIMRQVNEWKARELEAIRQQLLEAAIAQARTMLNQWKSQSEANIRADARLRSGAVVMGQVAEQLAPYMLAFPYNPKDARFIGSPIDLIVFDGMTENDLRRIIFLEVKTGGSQVSQRQRQIRDALNAGRVEWQLLEIRRPDVAS